MNTALTRFHSGGNGIGDEGAVAPANDLKVNTRWMGLAALLGIFTLFLWCGVCLEGNGPWACGVQCGADDAAQDFPTLDLEVPQPAGGAKGAENVPTWAWCVSGTALAAAVVLPIPLLCSVEWLRVVGAGSIPHAAVCTWPVGGLVLASTMLRAAARAARVPMPRVIGTYAVLFVCLVTLAGVTVHLGDGAATLVTTAVPVEPEPPGHGSCERVERGGELRWVGF